MRQRLQTAALCALVILPMAAVTAAQQRPANPQAPLSDETTGADEWTSGRYRLTPNDVIEVTFLQVPEFNQVLTVQPDGYVTLREAGDIRVQGRTLPQLREQLFDAYQSILRDPDMTIVLKEFDKPFFVVAGEVKTPGKYELRGALTVTQALAVAGGLSPNAKHSQVLLFRRFSEGTLEVKEINVKAMYAKRDLREDNLMRPGDTLLVPRNVLSRISRFIPIPGLGLYLNPLN
jgi:polysaccharide export outer membrane protein